MSKGVPLINKKEMPNIQVGVTNRVRKVTAADHFIIPAQSDCVIKFTGRGRNTMTCETGYIVEPTEHF